MKSEYVRISDEQKLALLQEHSFDAEFPSLDAKGWCLHCEKEFDGRSVRVWHWIGSEELWLECGTPRCDGSPIDWAPFPWWDEEHPATKAYHAQFRDLAD